MNDSAYLPSFVLFVSILRKTCFFPVTHNASYWKHVLLVGRSTARPNTCCFDRTLLSDISNMQETFEALPYQVTFPVTHSNLGLPNSSQEDSKSLLGALQILHCLHHLQCLLLHFSQSVVHLNSVTSLYIPKTLDASGYCFLIL